MYYVLLSIDHCKNISELCVFFGSTLLHVRKVPEDLIQIAIESSLIILLVINIILNINGNILNMLLDNKLFPRTESKSFFFFFKD